MLFPDDFADFITGEEWETLADCESDYIWDTIREYEHDDFINAKAVLGKYTFYYYTVKVEPGYYEGSQIIIENELPIFFNDYEEKREVQKELTILKECLLELAGCGYTACYPGWCTGYEKSYRDTVKRIGEAIKEAREEVRSTPTEKNNSTVSQRIL